MTLSVKSVQEALRLTSALEVTLSSSARDRVEVLAELCRAWLGDDQNRSVWWEGTQLVAVGVCTGIAVVFPSSSGGWCASIEGTLGIQSFPTQAEAHRHCEEQVAARGFVLVDVDPTEDRS